MNTFPKMLCGLWICDAAPAHLFVSVVVKAAVMFEDEPPLPPAFNQTRLGALVEVTTARWSRGVGTSSDVRTNRQYQIIWTWNQHDILIILLCRRCVRPIKHQSQLSSAFVVTLTHSTNHVRCVECWCTETRCDSSLPCLARSAASE